MTLVSPSLLSANFLRLGEEITKLEQAGADMLHLDIMDGHFVPNLTFGPPVIKFIKQHTKIPLDIHLMITSPECYIESYVNAGADFLTIHIEACTHIDRAIQSIKNMGAKAGVALNPSTHESSLEYIINQIDLVLVMSVNPGFSGQKFISNSLIKIQNIKNLLEKHKTQNYILSIDGGIDNTNINLIKQHGANCVVAGSYIFKNNNYERAINSLR